MKQPRLNRWFIYYEKFGSDSLHLAKLERANEKLLVSVYDSYTFWQTDWHLISSNVEKWCYVSRLKDNEFNT